MVISSDGVGVDYKELAQPVRLGGGTLAGQEVEHQAVDERGLFQLRSMAALLQTQVVPVGKQAGGLGGVLRVNDAVVAAADQQGGLRDLFQAVTDAVLHRAAESTQQTG